jgi:hypothetical protein
MRDELNMIALADRYLRGELNATDRTDFDERMRNNAELRELVEDQRALYGGLQRLALRPSVNKAYTSYRLGKWLPGVGGAIILGLLLTGAYIAIERLESQEAVNQEQTLPDPLITAPTEVPDTMTEAEWEGSPSTIEVRSHSQQTDTVVMIMRDGQLVPMTAQDTIGKRVYSRVITVPVEGSSPEELKARMDSMKKSGATYKRTGLEKISADSLQKLFGGDKAPIME